MSVITLNVDEARRTLSSSDKNVFVINDKNVDIVRFALMAGFADIALDEHSALRVMYQRPGETEVRAQTLTYYDTDGIRKLYDWELLSADLAKSGTLTVALCILRIDSEVEEWHTTPYQIRVLGSIHTDDSDEADETITPTIKERVAVLETIIQRVASGAPIVVSSTSAMTDTDQIYVLSTDGKWYYHNGTAWVAGGTYGAVATDTTLTQSGAPADAKTVGDEIADLKSDSNKLKSALTSVNDSVQSLDNGIIFNNADSAMSRLGLNLNIKGNILTINGTYVASARRRFSLKDLTKEGTSVASDWYATAISKLDSGKKYTVNIKEIDGTVTAPEGATGQIYNLQSYSTSGAIGLNAYKFPDRIASPLFISSGSDFSALVITIYKDMVFDNYRIMITVTEKTDIDGECYISATSGDDDNSGTKVAPFKSISHALELGYRSLIIKPEVYAEKISLNGGDISILPWVDDEAFSYDSPYRNKIEFINGTKLTPKASGTANIYQASYTAQSGSNIYKVFVDHSVTPTTQGSLSLEYNAMLIGDKPNTAKGNNKQRLYTPVLTETELSEQGTFWYGNNTIKFHPWDNVLDDAYYVPSDDAETIIDLTGMNSVIMEDVRIVGAYQNCAYIKKSNNVKINACEFGLCGKGMGLRLDNSNAEVYDSHAFGCAVDGFNLHEYGYSLFYGCTGFYCGDDGISHHQGCTGIIDGGEWAFNGRGSGNGAGVAPTFGSQIETRNIYSHDNHLGIMQEGRSGNRRPIRWNDNVVVDNDTDLYIQYYDVTAWNCIYKTKNVLNYGTFNEINNTVLS